MEKLKSILRSKAFWTLVTSIVAALAAFFMSSCSRSVLTFRGQGDVEFRYQGSNAPVVVKSE